MTTLSQNPQPIPPRSGHEPFHAMTKPIGPICNLDCQYCFYLEKEKLYPGNDKWKMPEPVLEEYIRQYIQLQDADEISFAWQGGEPTLLGVYYFRKVVELQKKYAQGKRVSNAFQTNGTLLDDAWCEFFRASGFLIGLSIDGPPALHDTYRLDKQQKPTFDAVERGLQFLKKHRVEFNTLTVVNRANSLQPLQLYRYLRQIGSGFIQFIPLVERAPTRAQLTVMGLDLAEPPILGIPGSQAPVENPPVTSWSVESRQYGEFLVTIFEEWVRRDVGKTFVQIFDVALGNWMGMGAGLCVFAEKCGRAMAVEHNGDVYSCDHYVYPRYHLGNLMNRSLGQMVNSPEQKKFGSDKSDTLPRYCRECEVRFACHGECPKHRFSRTPDGEAGLNYLCPAYKRFFNHIAPYMEAMAQLIRNGQPAARIMEMVQQREQRRPRSAPGNPGPNDRCPCGSGRKFKKCCGANRR